MALSLKLGLVFIGLFMINLFCFAQHRYVIVFSLYIILLTFIPKELVGAISGTSYSVGGIINLSIVAYDSLIILMLSVLFNHGYVKATGQFFYISLGSLILLFCLRFCVDGVSFLSNKVLDNYFLPVISALLMINYLNKEEIIKVLKVFNICILINAFIAIIEYLVGHSLFFHAYYYANVDWYTALCKAMPYGVHFRCTAFLGHPLTCGMYFLMGVVYLFNEDDLSLNLKTMAHFGILFLAIFTTNSRGALLIAGLYTLYWLIVNKQKFKLPLLSGCGILVLSLVDFKKIYLKLFNRDSSGLSMLVRVTALSSLLKMPLKPLLLGTGFNKADILFKEYTGGFNAEIAYLIVFLENGIIGSILWIITLVSMYTPHMCQYIKKIKFKRAVNGMLMCYLLNAATSNSFGDPGTLVYLLCFILGLSRVGSLMNLEEIITD
ncbi:MAG: hypothetical protein HUJ56_11465 [Erysipelotrichaceae bacterium]|nr:hypothetical protein [Erysipelotrichaceae bacterium]